MQAPKCKLCNKTHWGMCASPPRRPGAEFVAKIFPGESVGVGPKGGILIAHPERPPQLVPPGEILVLPPEQPKKRARRGTFDRTAYQREYMRKRRAKAKQQEATSK